MTTRTLLSEWEELLRLVLRCPSSHAGAAAAAVRDVLRDVPPDEPPVFVPPEAQSRRVQ